MEVCAILLSYKRPQNMQRIADHILKVSRVKKVILSNNNPEIDIRAWVDDRGGRIEIINQPVRMLYTKRLEIANSQDFDCFFCPDDDLFLYASQINYILDQVERNPTVPHGMYGQKGEIANGVFTMRSGIHRTNCEVDVLNRAYFFTKAHMNRIMELSVLAGWKDINDAIYMEDALISFSGEGRPVCHDIGHIADCPTSTQKGVATYLEDNFDAIRLRGYLKLADIAGRAL